MYCKKAPRSLSTGKKVMCDDRSASVSNQADSLCPSSHKGCELRQKGGNWICCMCGFGEGDEGPNRYNNCVGSDCAHVICSDCKKWTKK